MTINAQDQMLADAMATLADETVSAPVRSTRRTRIVETVTAYDAPAQGYAVTIAESLRVTVEARGFGDAVLAAIDKAAEFGMPEASRYVFMFDYVAVDSEGMVLDGADPVMRAALQAARIERSDARKRG